LEISRKRMNILIPKFSEFFISRVRKLPLRTLKPLVKITYLEFKAVMVLPEIIRNYGNYPYGNYVGNALIGKVITLNT